MVGSFFMLFMLNAGWTSNYVIKLAGFLFFAVGTAEAEERTDAFTHLKKPAYTSSAMCALAVVCQLLLKLLSPAAMAANVISILLSAATVYMSLNLMRMFLVALDSHRELVEDVSNIVRLQGSFNKLALMTFIYFGGDLLNRLIPIEFVTTLAGVIADVVHRLNHRRVGERTIVRRASFNDAHRWHQPALQRQRLFIQQSMQQLGRLVTHLPGSLRDGGERHARQVAGKLFVIYADNAQLFRDGDMQPLAGL